jgi:hypothetical protein
VADEKRVEPSPWQILNKILAALPRHQNHPKNIAAENDWQGQIAVDAHDG